MWNKISENLPNKDKKYLVLCDGYHKSKYPQVLGFARSGESVDDYDLKGKKNIFYAYDGEYGYYECTNVLYWMEIPQYPKD